jgi:hypothetical protein
MQTQKTEQAAVVEAETTYVDLGGGLAVAARLYAWIGAAWRRGLSLELRDAYPYVVAGPEPLDAADAEFVRRHRPGLVAYLRHLRDCGYVRE